MKKTAYKIKKESGKFHILSRPAGIQYFEQIGKSFFTESDAKDWIKNYGNQPQ